MKRKFIDVAMRNEVIARTKAGESTRDICESLGISDASVYKIRKEAGMSGCQNKGGVVSKSIQIPNIEEQKKLEEEPAPIMIADQQLTIAGTETLTTYRAELRKDTIIVDGELVVGEIKIDQLVSLANELKGVYDLVTRMKGNRFGLVD